MQSPKISKPNSQFSKTRREEKRREEKRREEKERKRKKGKERKRILVLFVGQENE